jgi:hypothetical protein
MAATWAARRAQPALLLEGSPRPGQKILSSGGRCNVLPAAASHSDFISDSSPHLVRKILAGWPLCAASSRTGDEGSRPQDDGGRSSSVSRRVADTAFALSTAFV